MSLRKLIKTFSVIGPAVLVSVELFDPASIVTATASGAAFGFDVLWAAFYSGIILIVIQEISARLGVVTGKSLAENIYEKYGRGYSYFLFVASIFLDLSTLTAKVMGLGTWFGNILSVQNTLCFSSTCFTFCFACFFRLPWFL
jgi:manganese transport protein